MGTDVESSSRACVDIRNVVAGTCERYNAMIVQMCTIGMLVKFELRPRGGRVTLLLVSQTCLLVQETKTMGK